MTTQKAASPQDLSQNLPQDLFQDLFKIPTHLQPYIATQDPSLYTAIDHAGWRFIMKISKTYFADRAHKKYLDGLEETGISTERIPLISEMDRKLRTFGWQAVAVSGFIPSAVFMEFLSLGILPVACDMRKLEHLDYTPAPDIVHEAAGHGPIISDSEYRDYLRNYGEISRKAISSLEDQAVYEAVRQLSEVKENPASTQEILQQAEQQLKQAIAEVSYVSEATLLSRMGWWTFEYGLIGEMQAPKIYGAGLLSSMNESFHCLEKGVKKLPFSIHCVEVPFDITRPQPQLFVAPGFHDLKEGLLALSDRMAFRRGGLEGLSKALKAKTTTTTVLDSGVQVSGTLTGILFEEKSDMEDRRPCYLKFNGPTQLCFENREISGHGAGYHKEGFGTVLEFITDELLLRSGVELGKPGVLTFSSGIIVKGILKQIYRRDGQILILTWDQCTVTHGAEVLFRPEWGMYDMVSGGSVVSVFGGAADRESYLEATGGFQQKPRKQKSNLTEENRELDQLYQRVSRLRESPSNGQSEYPLLIQLLSQYPEDWLLRYELLELAHLFDGSSASATQLRAELRVIAEKSPKMGETILRGLELVN